jgi:hypothetical protein
VRGLNGDNRQREVRSKIDESDCDIICLQETKCEDFDWRLIKKFYPRYFDRFAFSPSSGASGGLLCCGSLLFFRGSWWRYKNLLWLLNSPQYIIMHVGT